MLVGRRSCRNTRRERLDARSEPDYRRERPCIRIETFFFFSPRNGLRIGLTLTSGSRVIGSATGSGLGCGTRLVVCNFTPVPRTRKLLGAYRTRGVWREILNNDAREYGQRSAGGNLGRRWNRCRVSTAGRMESVNSTFRRWRVVLRWETMTK